MRIITTYYGPTDRGGSKIVARANGRQATIPYPYEARDPHAVAAQVLSDRMGDGVVIPTNEERARGSVFETDVRWCVQVEYSGNTTIIPGLTLGQSYVSRFRLKAIGFSNTRADAAAVIDAHRTAHYAAIAAISEVTA